jgi:hypothetical protein
MSIATMGAMAGAAGYRFGVDPLGIELWNDEVFTYLALPDKPILPF